MRIRYLLVAIIVIVMFAVCQRAATRRAEQRAVALSAKRSQPDPEYARRLEVYRQGQAKNDSLRVVDSIAQAQDDSGRAARGQAFDSALAVKKTADSLVFVAQTARWDSVKRIHDSTLAARRRPPSH